MARPHSPQQVGDSSQLASDQGARKHERIGAFAAGVAHDFNNYLGAIVAFSDSLLTSSDSYDSRVVEQIKLTALKATNLTKQMLIYAGKPSSFEAIVESVELNELISSLEPFLRAISPDSVRIKQLPNPVPVWANVCEATLQEIVICVVGACGEMPQVGMEDDLTISVLDNWQIGTSQAVFGEPNQVLNCQIEIHDVVGCLCFDEIEGWLSERFVESSEPVNRFYRSGCAVELEPRSVGGYVRIVVPLDTEEKESDDSKNLDLIQQASDQPNRTILVVDDEAAILNSASLLLESLGNQVVSACSATDAMQVMESMNSQIDCLILDYSMPGTNGLSLLNRFRSIGWNHPAILCSGYPMRIGDHPNAQFWPDGVLEKPFNFLQLQTAIDEACRNKASGGSRKNPAPRQI